jgi:hypothetical protein
MCGNMTCPKRIQHERATFAGPRRRSRRLRMLEGPTGSFTGESSRTRKRIKLHADFSVAGRGGSLDAG